MLGQVSNAFTSSSELGGEQDEPPLCKISPVDWNDYHWQLSHSINSLEKLKKHIKVYPMEEEALKTKGCFPMAITPYILSLMSDEFECPIRRQFIPTMEEFKIHTGDLEDSLDEEKCSPVSGIVHKYIDRVLFLVSMTCASYCRFCTRNRIVGERKHFVTDYEEQLKYIREHIEIRDVLLSGGDPLLLNENKLEYILQELRKMKHIEIIRIGSRVPVVLPMRITKSLVDMLKKYHPLYINIHIEHPKEFTPELHEALNKLHSAEIPLGVQSVILRKINDCPNIMKELYHKCLVERIKPYYLYYCDSVIGAHHFKTTIGKGIEIMENLIGSTSGMAIPHLVIDGGNGLGKVPILPNYLLSSSENSVVIRNYKGQITNYEQGEKNEHDKEKCEYCKKFKQIKTIASLLN